MDATERDQWREADRLFDALIELAPDARSRRVATLDISAGVRDKLEALLRRAGEASPLLDSDAALVSVLPLPDGCAADPLLGRNLGDWHLLELLGRGGMAVVYRAERVGGDYRQQAAVKVLSLVLRSQDDHARFRRERRILAQLQHPHIARLLDGGIAADGTPYLAMSLIEGERIDAWCEHHQLDIPARVRLLHQVCGAVAHANRLLVVHRDIKPANILVDDDGSACLLDFGIARLLDGDTTGEATLTRAFTPDYAAPEQRAGDVPLSTAVDVYGLGAVLHRLLTGQSPRLDAAGDPVPASQVAAAAGNPLAAHALRGDLDAILAQAMAREPQARYAGADALAMDLHAWLYHRPIQARRASLRGRVARLVRRNPGASALAALCLVLGLGGIVAVLLGQQQVREQALELQTVVDFQSSMLRSVEPAQVGARIHAALDAALADVGLDPELRRRAIGQIDTVGLAIDSLDEGMLRRAVDAARRNLADQPRVQARLLQSLASIYIDLNRFDQAAPIQREALDLFHRTVGPGDPLTLASLREQVDLGMRSGQGIDEAAIEDMLARHRRHLGDDSFDTALARGLFARWHMDAGNLLRAEAELRAALARMEALRGSEDPNVVGERAVLGQLLLNAGRNDQAAELLQQALAAARRIHDAQSASVLSILSNLATALARQGRLDEAEAMHAEVFQAYRASLGARHPRTLIALNNLAADARKRGDYAAALPLQEQARAGMIEVLGAEHPLSLRMQMSLGEVRLGLGEATLAAGFLTEALAAWERLALSPSPPIARAQRHLGQALQAQGRVEDAAGAMQASWDTANAIRSREEQRATAAAFVALYASAPENAEPHARWLARLDALDAPDAGGTPPP